MTQTLKNNISKLVNADIISVDFPKMGGILVVNGVEFDLREYYEGRGAKYNKNINHERVEVRITQKEIAKAVRHMKSNAKLKQERKNAINKASAKSHYNKNEILGTMRHAYTKSAKRYFPEIKELSRTKI